MKRKISVSSTNHNFPALSIKHYKLDKRKKMIIWLKLKPAMLSKDNLLKMTFARSKNIKEKKTLSH